MCLSCTLPFIIIFQDPWPAHATRISYQGPMGPSMTWLADLMDDQECWSNQLSNGWAPCEYLSQWIVVSMFLASSDSINKKFSKTYVFFNSAKGLGPKREPTHTGRQPVLEGPGNFGLYLCLIELFLLAFNPCKRGREILAFIFALLNYFYWPLAFVLLKYSHSFSYASKWTIRIL